MEKSYITRRIDELGRLVIPKEIRRNLKIKDNDQLEINVIDNKIILKKYEVNNNDYAINSLINTIKKCFNCNVLYTNLDKIVNYSLLNNDIISNYELSDDILNIIKKRSVFISKDSNILVMGSSSFIIIPININGDLLGSVIIYGGSYINNINTSIIQLISTFLENYLE